MRSCCQHTEAQHDIEGGYCNGEILTVVDTYANCPCTGWDRPREKIVQEG